MQHQKLKNNYIKGIILLLVTAIIWGGSFISQYFGGHIIGSFSFSGYVCILGSITIYIMILFDNKKRINRFIFFRDDENKLLTIKNSMFCGIFLFFAVVIQQNGVEITDASKSGLITSLEVIFVPILMFILYKRRIRFVTWLFILTSMMGIMMLSMNSLSKFNYGDLLVFISMILYSVSIIQVEIYVDGIDPLKFSFFRLVVVGFLGLFSAIIFREDFLNVVNIRQAIPSILYSGILSAGLAYTLSVVGQTYCEPVIATLIMSLEGIFAAIFGWLILSQALNAFQIVGILITFLSIVMVQITDNRV